MAKGGKQPISHLSTALLLLQVVLLPCAGNLNQLLQISSTWAATRAKPSRVNSRLASVSKQLPGSQAQPQLPAGCVAGQEQPHNPALCLCTRRKARCRSHNNNSITRSPISTSWGQGTRVARGGEVSPSLAATPRAGVHKKAGTAPGICLLAGETSGRSLWELHYQNQGVTTDLCVCLRQTSSQNQAEQEESANPLHSYPQPAAAIPCHGR